MVECLWAFRHVGFFYLRGVQARISKEAYEEDFRHEFASSRRHDRRRFSSTNWRCRDTCGSRDDRKHDRRCGARRSSPRLRETTDGVRVGENRHDNEQRLSAIFRQTTAGIAQTDLAGRFVLANPRFCEIVGRSAGELCRLRMQDITHPADLSANLRQFKLLITEGREFTVEKRYVRPDGSYVWVHNSVSLIRDRAGSPNYAVAFTLDITAQKEAEYERQRLLDRERAAHGELAESDRRKDEFLAMLGHELRNPLSTLSAPCKFWNSGAALIRLVGKCRTLSNDSHCT